MYHSAGWQYLKNQTTMKKAGCSCDDVEETQAKCLLVVDFFHLRTQFKAKHFLANSIFAPSATPRSRKRQCHQTRMKKKIKEKNWTRKQT
jgi:hypothetical protein